ncbi:MAG TPA: hypothetical protein PK402_10630, partial [Tepidisphaeraceae bacterium]|nr:hypothetical protein [Tepidisphaeraceae bacterium]
AISLTTDPMVSEKIDKGLSLDPDWNPTSDMIAYFGWNAKNNYGLLRFDFPGGASEQVVEFPRGRHPSWAPDGYRIVFDTDPNAGDSQLLIADIRKPDIKDTINITKDLLGKNYAPDWGACPDPHAKKPPMIARSSNYLVVSCKSGDDYILYSIKSDGTEMKEVGKFKGPLESAPKFSSNGKRAAAYANRNGKFEVFVSDLDGKEARSIGQGDSPLLSPDGSKVAYIKGDQFPVVTILDLTNPNAQPIPRSGGQPHRSGDSPWIGWSPDGKKVIFHSDLSGLTSVAPSLFSINADGSNCTKLIDIDGMGTGAAYSEDGKSIAYQISHPGGSSTYYMIPSNGGTAKMLFDGNVSMPQNWTTPDGSRVFVSKDNALFSMNLDGSDAKQIASGSLAFYWWKENGKNAGVIALDESRNNKLVLYNNDGTNPRWLDKLKNVGSFEWCDDGSNVEKKDEVVAAKGDFVLKDGTYKIKTTWGDLDPKSGWSVNSGVIKRSYETKVGWGDEAKPVTYSGQLAFTGPPPTLKPGQTFELSLSASGDYQTSMMGEWFIGSGKKEGDEAVAISQPGATNPWPTSGKLKVTFGEVVGDRYEVMLTVEKFLTVSWVYERK